MSVGNEDILTLPMKYISYGKVCISFMSVEVYLHERSKNLTDCGQLIY